MSILWCLFSGVLSCLHNTDVVIHGVNGSYEFDSSRARGMCQDTVLFMAMQDFVRGVGSHCFCPLQFKIPAAAVAGQISFNLK